MNRTDVRTQHELEQALAYGATRINLRGAARFTVADTGSSLVVAWGSSRVVARGSSRVEARDSSLVVAGSHVPVRVASSHRGDVDGGVRIDLPDPYAQTPEEWAAYQGVEVADGHVTLYKALDDDLKSAHGLAYPPGETVTAADFTDRRECGGGLHFGVTPAHATFYHYEATRWVACRVPLDSLIPLDDKAKSASCVVLHEVDRFGDRLDAKVIEDGFGSTWIKCGPGCDLQVVRPGKAQCNCNP